MTAALLRATPTITRPVGRKSDGNGTPRAEQERALATRAALLVAARRRFAEEGFARANTTVIVADANVTRGALYHHFGSKEGLFEAVYRQLAKDFYDRILEATREFEGQTWRRTIASVRLYLEITAGDHEIQQILLVDAPAVLGWRRWRELQADYLLKGWRETVHLLVEQGLIDPRPLESLALVIVGALDAASQAIAHDPDPETAQGEAAEVVLALLNGLKRA